MQELHQQRNVSGPVASVHMTFHMNLVVCRYNKPFPSNISTSAQVELENLLLHWRQELFVNFALDSMPKAISNSSD